MARGAARKTRTLIRASRGGDRRSLPLRTLIISRQRVLISHGPRRRLGTPANFLAIVCIHALGCHPGLGRHAALRLFLLDVLSLPTGTVMGHANSRLHLLG